MWSQTKQKKTPIIIDSVINAIGPQVWKFPNHLYQILLTNGFLKIPKVCSNSPITFNFEFKKN